MRFRTTTTNNARVYIQTGAKTIHSARATTPLLQK